MKKSKILGIALVAAMAASVAVVNASALSADEMKTHSVGICGAFNGWGSTPDVVMTASGKVLLRSTTLPKT